MHRNYFTYVLYTWGFCIQSLCLGPPKSYSVPVYSSLLLSPLTASIAIAKIPSYKFNFLKFYCFSWMRIMLLLKKIHLTFCKSVLKYVLSKQITSSFYFLCNLNEINKSKKSQNSYLKDGRENKYKVRKE